MTYIKTFNVLAILYFIVAVVISFVGDSLYSQYFYMLLGTICLATVAIIDTIKSSR